MPSLITVYLTEAQLRYLLALIEVDRSMDPGVKHQHAEWSEADAIVFSEAVGVPTRQRPAGVREVGRYRLVSCNIP